MSPRVEHIGDATLYLGDSLEVLPLIPSIDALITDPPYSSGGQFRGDRMAKTSAKYQQTQNADRYEEFTGDNRDQRSFAYWSAIWLGRAREIATPGALCAIFTDWRQLPTTTDAIQAGGWVWRGIGVWDKGEGVRPQLGRYRSQAEYFVWGTNGPREVRGGVAPGVFKVPVVGAEKEHMTAKPVALMRDMMRIVGETVLDPFMGSGTTGVAAVQAGRKFIGVEMLPHYFDTACRRIEQATKQGRLFREAAPEAVLQPSLLDGDAA
ncbi:MAG: site-specific DNA-methyltransferase [Proteobacteria bacterium]|nr:site-specific DNA-methyltransferase [Pseudomonadota bacterium]